MEYTRLIQAKLRHQELVAEARIARLATARRPASRGHFDRRPDPSPRLTTTTRTTRPAR